MKFINIIKNYLYENTGKSLLLLDIDDTLVKARNIFIHRKLPTDKAVVKLTPDEYAKDPNSKNPNNKKYYSYEEFRDPDKVAKSILTGVPLISNLKIMDQYIRNGWDIGILTARGLENIISKTMKSWLKFKNSKDNLEDIGDRLIRELVFAVNDDTKKYSGTGDFEKKVNVIKGLIDKYDRILFIDDDDKNINAVKNFIATEGKKNSKFKKIYVKKAVVPENKNE